MKIYIVDTFSNDIFHSILFHGRQQEKSYRLVDPMLGDTYTPLRLNRIGTFAPPITAVTVNWVVSAPVRDALQGMPLGFEAIQYRKLVDYPYFPPGDSRYIKTPEFQNASRKDLLKFFEYLPNVPAFHESIGARYEMLVPRLDDIKTGYRGLSRVSVRMNRSMPMQINVRLSAELLADHPVVWDYHHILSERAFAVIEPFLVRDFFDVIEAEF